MHPFLALSVLALLAPLGAPPSADHVCPADPLAFPVEWVMCALYCPLEDLATFLATGDPLAFADQMCTA